VWYYAKNGQQAGPVSQEDLMALLRDRVLTQDTRVWREGMGQWTPARQVQELMQVMIPAGMVPQPAPGMPYVQPPATNTMALTSMILGICGLVVAWIFAAIPAVICGHIARRQIRQAAGLQTGDGMALAGLITGYLVLILTALMIVGVVIFLIWAMEAASSAAPSVPLTPGPPGPGPSTLPSPAAP